MRNIFFKLFVFCFLALGALSCEKCNECSTDLSTRFRFVDSLRNEILTDPTQVSIVDFQNNEYPVLREIVEMDTFYLVDFRPLTPELESPDTVLFTYSNALVDSVEVDYTFSSDSRCCNNTLTVGRLVFFNRDAARRILPNYFIYDIIIED